MDENWGGTVMDQKDISEVVTALRETHKKLTDYDFNAKTVTEVTEDIEHIIDFLETNIEDSDGIEEMFQAHEAKTNKD